MKTLENPTSIEFNGIDGCCAMQAIAYAFKTDPQGLLYLYKVLKRKQYDGEGLDTKECNMLILALAAAHRIEVEYVKFKTSYKQFLKTAAKKGRFIVNQDNHVSFAENGKIVDDWGVYSDQILGYWSLKGRFTVTTHGALERKKELEYMIRSSVQSCLKDQLNKLRFTPTLQYL